MRITLKRSLVDKIGQDFFKKHFSIDFDSWQYRDNVEVVLYRLKKLALLDLKQRLNKCKEERGALTALNDISRWEETTKDAKNARPRTLRQFCDMMIALLKNTPGHRMYECVDGRSSAMYVNEVVYVPESKHGGYYSPAYTQVKCLFDEFGCRESSSYDFLAEECVGFTLGEALIRKNLFVETDELRSSYLLELRRYREIAPAIGRQFLATGFGSDDVDGNEEDSKSWWRRWNTQLLPMELEGTPSRVVIDIPFEDSEQSRRRSSDERVSAYFWDRQITKDEDEEDESEETVDIEIPIKTVVPIFDMRRHIRLKVHVANLSEYVYDSSVFDKLILDDATKDLVKMLVRHEAGYFQDVVKNKSGGAIVLLAGAPGLGKTLTAEVFSEYEQRPLYSVQCAQLGVKAQELEDNLLKIFKRARRWNAIPLLDEADVYVRQRGDDLEQNAIVGVFLRVLEYQPNVLFLTTNRPDIVDDAIESRCLVRLIYAYPTPLQQEKIWKVLAQGAGLSASSTEISTIVKENPDLSGRDIKNLVKLVSLVLKSTNAGDKITAERVRFARKFRPSRKFE